MFTFKKAHWNFEIILVQKISPGVAGLAESRLTPNSLDSVESEASVARIRISCKTELPNNHKSFFPFVIGIYILTYESSLRRLTIIPEHFEVPPSIEL